LKPERWGSPLVQEEKYQEKPVKREEEKEIIITAVTANKFKKSFQSETKQIKNVTQNIKGKWEEKWMHGQFSCSLDEKLVD
jgi:hypothetical protein